MTAPYSVVILSANASNLVTCVRTIFEHEPDLPRERIVVVDDGARAGAEALLPGITWVTGARPFVFARNANLGIQAAGTDVILLNDDCQLLTPCGFTRLAAEMQARPTYGVGSAGVRGAIGNPRQVVQRPPRFRAERDMLAFVCVYIPRETFNRVGFLDERFSGYGFDDNDYCDRVKAAGLALGIWDGCVVDHSGALPSSYRTRPDLWPLFHANRQRYHEKAAGVPVPTARRVDLLYLACNRLEFTRETFTTLVTNTEWAEVNELFVIDDGSVDGTREWLADAVTRVPAPVRFLKTGFGSPVSAMRHFIELARAPILAKIDNDAMVPPGWLRQSLEVLERHQDLALLGIEAMYPHVHDLALERSFTPAPFISGLGLYRREAFARSRPETIGKYFGLEEWQMAHGRGLTRGWITPALAVFLLDHLPFEPWRSLSQSYVDRGWQRTSPPYDPDCTLWCWRWPEYQPPTTTPEDITHRLNLSYVPDPLDGYTNASVLADNNDASTDLRESWPWETGSVGEIRAWNVVEYLPDRIRTMNELWRVLRPGGTAEISVPTTDGPGAFQDPACVSFWNRRSFLYVEVGNPYRERFATHYGIEAKFRVLAERTESTPDGPRLTITLQAIKP